MVSKEKAVAIAVGTAAGLYGLSKILGKAAGAGETTTTDSTGTLRLVIHRTKVPAGLEGNIPISAEISLFGQATEGDPLPSMELRVEIEWPKGSGTYIQVGSPISFASVPLLIEKSLYNIITPTVIQVLGGLVSASYGSQKFRGRMVLQNIFGTDTKYTASQTVTLGTPPKGSISVGPVI